MRHVASPPTKPAESTAPSACISQTIVLPAELRQARSVTASPLKSPTSSIDHVSSPPRSRVAMTAPAPS